MKEVIFDALLDTIKLIPFLFIAFLIIEIIEHKISNKSKKVITKSKKYGPVLGALLGALPQCGFSVMATNLYVTRIISLGTLISIYLSTSDEMLPILISEKAPFNLIFKIILIKVLLGIIYGILIDILFNRIFRRKEKENFEICDKEHCHCEEHILLSALKHTIKIAIFILATTFIINIFFHFVGEEYLSKILLKNTILGPLITCLIGLVPNCGASVIITELYLNNSISLAALISGLLSSSGTALLVLFKSNKNIKENIFILSLLYLIGVFTGIILELINLINKM